MFCNKCGAELLSGSEFCSKCGAAVVAQHATAVATDSVRGRDKRKSKVGNILTYIAAGLIVLFFGSATLSMLNGDGPSPNDSSQVGDESATVEPETGGSAGAMGETVVTDSGVEVTAVSTNSNPDVPNEFVIDEGDVKGQLVSIRFKVANRSNEEISISNGSVLGFISEAKYESVAVFSTSGDWYVFEPLGPGLETVIDAYFDVPSGQSLTGATFLTSIFLGEEAKFIF
jgi:hypothetical protein